jgi:hypothetical protein
LARAASTFASASDWACIDLILVISAVFSAATVVA